MPKTKALVPAETIINKIYFIRGQKVMFDFDLAEMYSIETRAFNQAVRRNLERFPADFMFQLNKSEFEIWQQHILISQNVTSSWGGRRKLPYVFTEQGVAMLSSVLKSKTAIQVNIAIMRTFTKLREILSTNKQLREKIEKMESQFSKKFKQHDVRFKLIFQAIKQLVKTEDKPKNEIGFKLK